MAESKRTVILDVQGLSVAFDSYDASLKKSTNLTIADLSIQIHTGEILAVVGSSGSGKSLLAHAIMGILPYNARVGGKMTYKGKELTREYQEKLQGKEIAFIPQSVAYLDPLMRVGEQVRGTGGERLREAQRKAFKKYRLDEKAEKLYPFQLSGGMARRILISTAVVANAELIIADEPTPGLDLNLAIQALKDLREFADLGKGVLLITHDIDLALNVADRISIFHSGTVVETARKEDFSGDGEGLKHLYSRALFRALPQNGFQIARCPKCGLSCAVWEIDGDELRCACGYHA
ncbi:ABC transporter ATP-binding protein [Desulfosporosinus youngiae]|uniref:Nickel import system ATP-binding protein NikD n=1 Tax=Desulfosporosinus youngiae DSM 17734 TaxID=768710 RepID=H5XUB6_9FIRM|nr:ABC transporter ATP-binding protein [Desulfosporosinus youngiae]EHQ89352.1 ABC-type dipeptide/oligopeptide/nickel transport system, ATPase component [Desulfosporosinus youngiae DSM 17734]